MKNKKTLIIVSLLLGIVTFSVGMSMIQNAENRLFPGILMLVSILIIGTCSKSIANDYILKDYLDKKIKLNKKSDKKRENEVKQISSSRSNLIVSLLLVVAVIVIIFTKTNYIILTILIIASIFLQSYLNAFLYIYYDKKIKEKL